MPSTNKIKKDQPLLPCFIVPTSKMFAPPTRVHRHHTIYNELIVPVRPLKPHGHVHPTPAPCLDGTYAPPLHRPNPLPLPLVCEHPANGLLRHIFHCFMATYNTFTNSLLHALFSINFWKARGVLIALRFMILSMPPMMGIYMKTNELSMKMAKQGQTRPTASDP